MGQSRRSKYYNGGKIRRRAQLQEERSRRSRIAVVERHHAVIALLVGVMSPGTVDDAANLAGRPVRQPELLHQPSRHQYVGVRVDLLNQHGLRPPIWSVIARRRCHRRGSWKMAVAAAKKGPADD
jgi:hypothetical protein